MQKSILFLYARDEEHENETKVGLTTPNTIKSKILRNEFHKQCAMLTN